MFGFICTHTVTSIRTVISKRNPWSHYYRDLHRPLAELKLPVSFTLYANARYTTYVLVGGVGVERRMLGLNSVCVWDGLIYAMAFANDGDGRVLTVEQIVSVIMIYGQVHPSLSPQRQAMKAMVVWCDMFREHCIDRVQPEDEGRAAAAILGEDPAILKIIDLME